MVVEDTGRGRGEKNIIRTRNRQGDNEKTRLVLNSYEGETCVASICDRRNKKFASTCATEPRRRKYGKKDTQKTRK